MSVSTGSAIGVLCGLVSILFSPDVQAVSASTPARPRVLIIGDSISIGYNEPVREMLSDVADVAHNPGNAADTWKGLEELDTWLGSEKWSVIHFNWGLHDLKHVRDGKLDLTAPRVSTTEQYRENLDKLVLRLKESGAKLIWASTTPIPEGAAGRIKGQEIEFNTAAREVMDRHGVTVNDLHTWVWPHLGRYQQKANVHFTEEGSRFLAERVARKIRNTLQDQRPPFEMPAVQPPVFPDRHVSIEQFGAVGDGKTLNTSAIARAIADCAEKGGGRVLIPPGVWLTGAIHLKSNVELHLAEGAELRFSTNPADYLPAVFVRWGGFECWNYSPLIYARDCVNIAVTGRGKLEGQGKAWWGWVKEQDRVSRRLYDMVLAGVDVEQRLFADEKEPLRPQFIQPINCRNVLIEGVTITSGPFWTIQAVYCENVLVRNITVTNEGPNNDGFNADSCRNVLVEHCTFATGDDSVAIKSGLNEDGWRVGRPSENIVVRHCRMMRGHGGVVIGSDMSGGVRNVFVHDCDFSGSQIGIRLKSSRGRGGIVENVYYRDIDLGDIQGQAITIHTDYKAYFGADQGKAPAFRKIHISDVICRKAAQAVRLSGLPEQLIEDVVFERAILGAKEGMTCSQVKGLRLADVAVTPAAGPVMRVKDSRQVTLQRAVCPRDADPFLRVEGAGSGEIRVMESDLSLAKKSVELAEGAPADAVAIDDKPVR
ncbi:MAG TPA: glycosyl hydrolase family 28 protein [Phycisphaerae bacterium]|nr:glycosyl hydrolase family 28 protein [Phycisphaerae bacterium]HRR85942.1 glycosyl hydrolase family 28 protein [Phycisphaerae bacterium]